MLYVYGNKVYIKPLQGKLIEVTVTKKGNDYNVEATKNKIEINQDIKDKLNTITVEKAYKMTNRSKFSDDTAIE